MCKHSHGLLFTIFSKQVFHSERSGRRPLAMTMFEIFIFSLCIFLVAGDPLEFLSDEEKENVGKMHILDLPINARRVVRDVTLHGNATWVLLCIWIKIKYHFHMLFRFLYERHGS